MSEEFTFEEFCNFSWNDSVCLKSQKDMNFTMSDASKNQYDSKFFEEEQNPTWNIDQFNKNAQKKLKNRQNAKNFRQRKKNQHQKLSNKIRLLQEQNICLKNSKHCKHCNRRFNPLIEYKKSQSQVQQNLTKSIILQKQVQFQKPSLMNKQQQSKSGKIWIALGILLMIIGVHIYGFKGKDGYKDISIKNIQSNNWIKMFDHNNDKNHIQKQNNAQESNKKSQQHVDDYYNVEIKLKDKKDKQKYYTKQNAIFKTIRIFNQNQEQSQKSKDYANMAQKTIQKLDMIQQNAAIQNDQLTFVDNHDHDQIKFHKQLLFAIQAEIDDLGNYI